MSKRFLHIAFDSIFLDYTIEQFETLIPNQSEYIVDVPEKDNNIKYIKNKNLISTKVLDDKKALESIIKNISAKNILILHCLNSNMIDIVNNVDKNITIIWLVWGAEVNSLPKLRKRHFQPLTKRLLYRINRPSLRSKIYERFPRIHYQLYKIKNGKNHPDVDKIKAFNRINYAGIFVKEDFDLFNNTYAFNLKNLWYCYYNIEDTTTNVKQHKESGRINILIGNSADPRNNHIDIFNILGKANTQFDKIICPLSYGTTNSQYVKEVVRQGEIMFGNRFSPILNFMPLQEYNKVIYDCSIAIFNHNVQQSVGNIITMIWNGSKVFLQDSNPLMKYFKRIGLIIFSINQGVNEESFIPLSRTQVVKNQNILKSQLSKRSVLNRTEELIAKL